MMGKPTLRLAMGEVQGGLLEMCYFTLGHDSTRFFPESKMLIEMP